MSEVVPSFDEVSARLWVAYGVGTGMYIEAAVYDEAIEMGYIENIKQRLPAFADPKVMRQTLSCSHQAGALAAAMAVKLGKRKITAEIFKETSELVAVQQSEARAKNPEQVDHKLRGGIC